jgi:hypothetical protein
MRRIECMTLDFMERRHKDYEEVNSPLRTCLSSKRQIDSSP